MKITEYLSVNYISGGSSAVWVGHWERLKKAIEGREQWVEARDIYSGRPILIRISDIANIGYWSVEAQRTYLQHHKELREVSDEYMEPEVPWD